MGSPHDPWNPFSPLTKLAAVSKKASAKPDLLADVRRALRDPNPLSHFGLKGSASQRAGAMLQAAGFDSRTHDLSLGSPDYLVATRRQHMIEVRDEHRDLADLDFDG